MNIWALVLALAGGLTACASFKKDNEPQATAPPIPEEVVSMRATYMPLAAAQLDSRGLVQLGGSIGDSALFSCLARVSGVTSFDPGILFRGGKPVRHPDIEPGAPKADGSRGTPISKDMVSGHLWCLYDLVRKGDKDRALELVSAMIEFGKQHGASFSAVDVGWMFCTDQDKVDYQIGEADWYGKCFMPPAVVRDIYRVAKLAGYACDDDCKTFETIGPNIPADNSGFRRHLAVIGTVRNGLIDGAINDNSLHIVLDNAAKDEPRNALYLAAQGLFTDGNQEDAFEALLDHSLFPADHLPTKANYCSEYLFQRDHMLGTMVNPDWLPCAPEDQTPDLGRGIEWLFAAAVALGDVR